MTPTQPLDAMRAGFTKMYEGLSEVLTAVRQCEEATLEWAESPLGDADVHQLSGPRAEDPPAPESTTDTPDEKEGETPEPAVSLEDVRGELARLAKSGRKDIVKQLITDHGGTKLSDVPQDQYPALLEEAKKVD